jgi:coenzyme Q-binding protein COQ10
MFRATYTRSMRAPKRHLLTFKQPTISHSAQKVVHFSPEKVFDVVADVNSYKEFLPFCMDSTITSVNRESAFEADLTVGFGVLSGSYSSIVKLKRPHSIVIKAVRSSLFEFLESHWQFDGVSTHQEMCKVSFQINLKAASFFHTQTLSKIFPEIANKQLIAFEKRCMALYSLNK